MKILPFFSAFFCNIGSFAYFCRPKWRLQLTRLEHWFVVPGVVGSNPIIRPKCLSRNTGAFFVNFLYICLENLRMNPVFLKRFLIVIYAAGLFGMHLPATAALFTSQVPLTLWFAVFICVVYFPKPSFQAYVFLGLLAIAAWYLEVQGVMTEWPKVS